MWPKSVIMKHLTICKLAFCEIILDQKKVSDLMVTFISMTWCHYLGVFNILDLLKFL